MIDAGHSADSTRSRRSTLSPGTRLGPYVLAESIGAGGMGEVYRARDERLGREVAIKVLAAAFHDDAHRLRRFEQEARTVAALSHPNILAVFDFDARGATPYLVTEILEGTNLRRRLGQPRPWRAALDWALQIARGLAAAHDKAIVHRDIKPENLFVTGDGRVKILDFGIARTLPSEAALAKASAGAPVLAVTAEPGARAQVDPAVAALPVYQTTAGVVVGTAGYMSPEQVRGEAPDHRSDLFSFGAVLYELLTGQPSFPGDSPIEKAAAVLKVEPPPLASTLGVPTALERVMRRCLQKDPADRFQSTRDLVFDLQEILDTAITGSSAPRSEPPLAVRRTLRRVAPLVAVALAAGLVTLGVVSLPRHQEPPRYKRITFRRGAILTARFSPDGRQIVYSAAIDGDKPRVYITTPDNPEGRAITEPGVGLFALSSTGELALRLPHAPGTNLPGSTLARAPLDGGAPRAVLNGVLSADWSPDGSELAVVRHVDGRDQLEYPVGKVHFSSAGEIGSPRVSPSGDAVVFASYPFRGDDRGSVEVAWRDGRRRTLSAGWMSIQGLAWTPRGDEIYFGANGMAETRGLHAVTLDGKVRLLSEGPGPIVLQDMARDGRVLIYRDLHRRAMYAIGPDTAEPRDVSWLDMPWILELSRDGRRILFIEGGDGAQCDLVTYYRDLDGSPAVRVGVGVGWSLSPDGQQTLMSPAPYAELRVQPLGLGTPRPLPAGRIGRYDAAMFLPDGKRIAVTANEPGRRSRVWLQRLDGGDPAPISEEGTRLAPNMLASPDSSTLMAVDIEGHSAQVFTDGHPLARFDAIADGDSVVQWPDADHLIIRKSGPLPARLVVLDLITHTETPWRELGLTDTSGQARIPRVLATADRRVIAYQLTQNLADLYLISGLK